MKKLGVVILLGVIQFGACGGSTTDTSNRGNLASCVHTTTEGTFRRDSDTLPVGACVVDSKEPVCKLVLRNCPCVNVQAPRTFYSCTCKAGAWSCEKTAQDMGMCPSGCLEPDAGCPQCILDDGGVTEGGNADSGYFSSAACSDYCHASAANGCMLTEEDVAGCISSCEDFRSDDYAKCLSEFDALQQCGTSDLEASGKCTLSDACTGAVELLNACHASK